MAQAQVDLKRAMETRIRFVPRREEGGKRLSFQCKLCGRVFDFLANCQRHVRSTPRHHGNLCYSASEDLAVINKHIKSIAENYAPGQTQPCSPSSAGETSVVLGPACKKSKVSGDGGIPEVEMSGDLTLTFRRSSESKDGWGVTDKKFKRKLPSAAGIQQTNPSSSSTPQGQAPDVLPGLSMPSLQ
jgi:hypothetical protein